MAYELFKRSAVRVETPSIALVPDGRIGFNAAAARILRENGVKSVFLLWDRENRKIALKAAAKGERNAFAVSLVRQSHSGSLRAKSFFAHLGLKLTKRELLPASWDAQKKMLEVALPEKLNSSSKEPDSKEQSETASAGKWSE